MIGKDLIIEVSEDMIRKDMMIREDTIGSYTKE